MHASFLLGLALIGPFALEALIDAPRERRLTVLRDWTLFGLGAALVALINPQGYEAFLYPLKVMNLRLLSSISEWRPASFDHVEPMEIALLALLGLAFFRPVRLRPLRLASLLGLVHMALHQGRQQMVLAIVAPLLLAGPMAQTFPTADAREPTRERAFWRGAFALMALFAAARLLLPVTRVDSPTAPISALAATPPALRDQPVLNELGFGGLLIFSHVRPFIDGRTDMYGDRFFFDYDHMVEGNGAAFDAALPKYGFKWVMLRPDAPLAKALAARPDWRRLYGDDYAVVLAGTDALK
ncbi:MAG TPA: hypothetical protein VMU18_10655, partial [Rhodoblastus sp.]|nr:hypothetical protein [Rhodoblastus sp.]